MRCTTGRNSAIVFGVVARIERHLAPSFAKIGAILKVRVASELLPRIAILSNVVPKVVALENRMVLDDPVCPLTDKGLEYCGGHSGMISGAITSAAKLSASSPSRQARVAV
jgi:hypothetical protein